MAKWRVYNRHPNGYTHKEMFRGDPIEIKAGDYVLMDYEDAVQFRGQYFPMIIAADGTHDPKGFKVIKIEPDEAEQKHEVKLKYICQLDKKEFNSQEELDAYIKANYADRIFKDETLEIEIESEKKKRR